MIQLQVLNKILDTKDFSIVEENSLDVNHFNGYEKEFEFIKNHYDKYKNVPDKETFLEKFEDFDLLEVSESNDYLIDKLKEEYLYNYLYPTVEKMADLMSQGDTNAAYEYVQAQIKKVPINNRLGGIDIVKSATKRYDEFKSRAENQSDWYFQSGFPELDDVIHGIQRGEELMILFARVNEGKSWCLEKMCVSVWEQGFNVGYISPEMSASSIGFRFDTLHKNFSNRNLMWGEALENEKDYQKYLKELEKKDNKFVVATPLDFNNNITITKLRNWIRQNELDMLAIDGITYLNDERGKNRDNKTTSLTNISEDLMSLSVEMKIPILAVVQANRSGVAEEGSNDTPELESIRDSDGMAMNASKVLSIRQRDGVLNIGVKKQRNGVVGSTIKYLWNIDKGEFVWVPSEDSAVSKETVETKIQENNDIYLGDITDIF